MNSGRKITVTFKKLSTVSLTDLFTEEIKRMILSGELRAGEKLPPERQLAEEMNVSLAVVHAGVTRLTALGFLRAEPRRGTFVADYLRTGDLNTMMAVADFSGRALDSDAFELLTVFRRSFEVLAARKACENRTEDDLRKLEALERRIAAQEGDLPELCFELHHEVALATGNPYCGMVIQSFRPVYLFFYRKSSPQGYLASISAVLDAVRERDPERAEAVIHRSIDRWMQEFEKTEKYRRS